VERCVAWADELTALHVRHGEPYVGARLEAAGLLHACGRPEDARERLVEALDAMPRWARAAALNTLGVLAHEAGDDGGAIVHLQAALHHDPALHEARGNLVRVLLRLYEGGGSDFARDDIRKNLDAWLELAPDDPRVHVQRAALEVIRARREPANAEAARSTAELQLVLVLRSDPPPTVAAEALVVLGRLWLDRGDEATALRAFRHALALDPTRAAASLMGAAVMLRMRDFEGAYQQLEAAAVTVDPVEERTRLRLLAVALRGLERYAEAAKTYERLLAVERPEAIDLYNRAQLERYVLVQEESFDAKRVIGVRDRFARAAAAAAGDPAQAELERSARAAQQQLDALLVELSRSTVRGEDPEAKRLEQLERKQRQEERPKLLELEAKAREAWERERRTGAEAPREAPEAPGDAEMLIR
jgi:tetratricopeptide (TPR) repeat protein